MVVAPTTIQKSLQLATTSDCFGMSRLVAKVNKMPIKKCKCQRIHDVDGHVQCRIFLDTCLCFPLFIGLGPTLAFCIIMFLWQRFEQMSFAQRKPGLSMYYT